jgi:hypothetical protein
MMPLAKMSIVLAVTFPIYAALKPSSYWKLPSRVPRWKCLLVVTCPQFDSHDYVDETIYLLFFRSWLTL